MRFFEDLSCGGCVADRGRLVDVEDDGEVEWVGAVCEGLLELPVNPQALNGPGQSSQDQVAQGPLTGP